MKSPKIQILNTASLTEEIIEFVKANNLCDYEGTKNLEDFLAKKTRWLQLFNIQYSQPNGTGYWSMVSRKKKPSPGDGQPLVADAVVVIPLLKNSGKRKVVTIKEFRIPLGAYEYAFPAGLYDHNETAEAVAKRELKEETGLKLTKVLYVSSPVVSSAGLSDESVVYVVCECTGEPDTSGNEGTEDIEVNVLDLDGITNLVNSNHNISSKTLPFLLMFLGAKKIAWPKNLRE